MDLTICVECFGGVQLVVEHTVCTIYLVMHYKSWQKVHRFTTKYISTVAKMLTSPKNSCCQFHDFRQNIYFMALTMVTCWLIKRHEYPMYRSSPLLLNFSSLIFHSGPLRIFQPPSFELVNAREHLFRGGSWEKKDLISIQFLLEWFDSGRVTYVARTYIDL